MQSSPRTCLLFSASSRLCDGTGNLLEEGREAENHRRGSDTQPNREAHDRRNQLDEVDVCAHVRNPLKPAALIPPCRFKRASNVPRDTPRRSSCARNLSSRGHTCCSGTAT